MSWNEFRSLLLCLYFATIVSCHQCPTGWLEHRDSCYKFTRSPIKNLEDALSKCQAYNADLISINTIDEHNFVSEWLRINDPQFRRWYTSGRDTGDNYWVWDGDNSQFTNVDVLWLPQEHYSFGKHVAYNFSAALNKWGLVKVFSSEELSYICEIFKENLHQIVIIERHLDYGMIVKDPNKLPRGPQFILEPKPVIFDQNGRSKTNEVSLKCVANGYPIPTYKWYKEEYENDEVYSYPIDPLSDYRYTQTDGILIIYNPDQSKDRGKYHCTATNRFGTVISQTTSLSFGNIGEFNRKRSSDYGKENWGKSLSCDPPQHYPSVGYYWSRSTFQNFVNEDQRIFMSHDGNLYFSSLERTDQANYSCNVRSPSSTTGRTGPFVPLIVESASSGQKLQFPNNFPKAFPDAPLLYEEVRLECIAYGYPVAKYNWTRRGSNNRLPETARIENYNRVFRIPQIKIEDMGDYVCTADNTVESIQKSISVRVQAFPEFTVPLEHKVVDLHSKLTWSCEAFGIPDVTYKWFKNGKELRLRNLAEDINRIRIHENILTIEDITKKDEGMYQCQAENQLGAAYSSAQLRVLKLAPTFEKYPMEQEIYAPEQGNVTIACRPEAAPFPDFVWKHDGIVIASGRFQVLKNGYLHIRSIRQDDEGLYECMAKNEYGADYTSGRLVVMSPPRMLESPHPKPVAMVNNSVELKCLAYTTSPLDIAYIWLHNGLKIDFGKEPQYTVGQSSGDLYIHNITLAEAGYYSCIAKTSIGYISSKTELVVIGPPGPPGAVLAEELTASSGQIHWSDGADNGRRIRRYVIEGRTNHNSTWLVLANVTNWSLRKNDRKEVLLDHVLSPWSTYNFRISSINELGQGPPSDPSPQYNTEIDLPYVAPLNVGGGEGKVGSLTITWDPLSPKDWNAPEVWYKIYYKPLDSKQEFYKKDLREHGNIHMYVVYVGEEEYYKQYLVKVQAINSVGAGPESKEVDVYTAERMPQVQPTQVLAIPFNSTALNVSWAPLELHREKIRGKLIGHRIKYWKNGDNPETDSLILLKRGSDPWGLIVGLQPNTEYWVTVMAYNSAGSGVESERFLARTFKAAPLRIPTNVEVTAISATSVLVTWRGILTTTDEEPILGYKVRYWEADQDMTSAREVIRYLDNGDLEAIVSDLKRGKVYRLRVLAFSYGGDGKMSSPAWEFLVGDPLAKSYAGWALSFSFSVVFLTLLLHL